MDSSELKNAKREMLGKVNTIFDDFEESNSRIPIMEEFRVIIADSESHYLGLMDQTIIDDINPNLERQWIRETAMWDTVSELEVEARTRRSGER